MQIFNTRNIRAPFVAFCAGLLLLASPEVAEARYLDPGTGTMIIQVIVAAFATIFLFFRSAWTSVKMAVLKMVGKAPEIEE